MATEKTVSKNEFLNGSSSNHQLPKKHKRKSIEGEVVLFPIGGSEEDAPRYFYDNLSEYQQKALIELMHSIDLESLESFLENYSKIRYYPYLARFYEYVPENRQHEKDYFVFSMRNKRYIAQIDNSEFPLFSSMLFYLFTMFGINIDIRDHKLEGINSRVEKVIQEIKDNSRIEDKPKTQIILEYLLASNLEEVDIDMLTKKLYEPEDDEAFKKAKKTLTVLIAKLNKKLKKKGLFIQGRHIFDVVELPA